MSFKKKTKYRVSKRAIFGGGGKVKTFASKTKAKKYAKKQGGIVYAVTPVYIRKKRKK